jgi:integrase
MITKVLLDHAANNKHSSTIKLYNVINGVLDMAFLDDSITINPMLKVKRPKPLKEEEGKDDGIKALDEKELCRVLSCVKNEPMKWQAFIGLASDTGCRRGELCALEWDDINLDDGIVMIRRNLQYTSGKGVYFTSPKNGKKREVDIGPETVELLRKWKKEQQKLCVCRYVFNPERSNQYKHLDPEAKHSQKTEKKPIPIVKDPMHPQSPTKFFKDFGNKYGIPDFHPHLLRHTFASVAITNGADVTSVSARLGHSDSAVTLRMYRPANAESITRAGQIARDALKAAASGG